MPPPKKPKNGPTRLETFLSDEELRLEHLKSHKRPITSDQVKQLNNILINRRMNKSSQGSAIMNSDSVSIAPQHSTTTMTCNVNTPAPKGSTPLLITSSTSNNTKSLANTCDNEENSSSVPDNILSWESPTSSMSQLLRGSADPDMPQDLTICGPRTPRANTGNATPTDWMFASNQSEGSPGPSSSTPNKSPQPAHLHPPLINEDSSSNMGITRTLEIASLLNLTNGDSVFKCIENSIQDLLPLSAADIGSPLRPNGTPKAQSPIVSEVSTNSVPVVNNAAVVTTAGQDTPVSLLITTGDQVHKVVIPASALALPQTQVQQPQTLQVVQTLLPQPPPAHTGASVPNVKLECTAQSLSRKDETGSSSSSGQHEDYGDIHPMQAHQSAHQHQPLPSPPAPLPMPPPHFTNPHAHSHSIHPPHHTSTASEAASISLSGSPPNTVPDHSMTLHHCHHHDTSTAPPASGTGGAISITSPSIATHVNDIGMQAAHVGYIGTAQMTSKQRLSVCDRSPAIPESAPPTPAPGSSGSSSYYITETPTATVLTGGDTEGLLQRNGVLYINNNSMLTAESLLNSCVYSDGHVSAGGSINMVTSPTAAHVSSTTDSSGGSSLCNPANCTTTPAPSTLPPNSATGGDGEELLGATTRESSPEDAACGRKAKKGTPAKATIKQEGNVIPYDRQCLICSDCGSGFHYGVWSCEGCKAFFKRSLQGTVNYICPATNNCTIDKRRRKCCPACRLAKCQKVGMSKSDTRKERVRAAPRKRKADTVKAETSSKLSKMVKEEAPTRSGRSTTKRSPSLVEALLRITPGTAFKTNHDNNLPDSEMHLMNSFVELLHNELIAIVNWAKAMPGYKRLSVHDQSRLLETAWMELLVLQLCSRSMSSKDELVFAQDLHMDRERFRVARIEKIGVRLLGLTARFSELQVTQEENAILKSIALLNADVISVDNPEMVQSLRSELMAALVSASGGNKCSNATGGAGTSAGPQKRDPQRMGHLLLLLPHVREASTMVIVHLFHLQRRKAVHVGALLGELLEGTEARLGQCISGTIGLYDHIHDHCSHDGGDCANESTIDSIDRKPATSS